MASESVRVYIGLGSNLDDPIAHLRRACADLGAIEGIEGLRCSSLYHSPPLSPPQPDYINAVAVADTALSPLALLGLLQSVEDRHGRIRAERWGSRTLDLDLLLFGEEEINHPRLTVPHPEMANRPFVLLPLLELDPGVSVPGLGAAGGLLSQIDSSMVTRLGGADD